MFDETTLFETASPAAIAIATLVYVALLGGGTITALILAWRLSARHPSWRQRMLELQARPWTWKDGGAVLAIVLLVIAATLAVASLVSKNDHVALLMVQTLLIHMCGLALVLGYLRWRGYGLRPALGLQWSGAVRFLAAGAVTYVGILPLVFFASLVYQVVLSSKGYPSHLQDVALLLSGQYSLWVRLYMIAFAVVVAPVFEETIFRGIALPLLSRRFGTGAGVFLSSLLFSAIHFHVPSLVPLFILATGFSLAYIYTGSLWTPIAMHGLFNGINLGLLLLLRTPGGPS